MDEGAPELTTAVELDKAFTRVYRAQGSHEDLAVLVVSEKTWKRFLMEMTPLMGCSSEAFGPDRYRGVPVIVSPHYEGPPCPLPASLFESQGLTAPRPGP